MERLSREKFGSFPFPLYQIDWGYFFAEESEFYLRNIHKKRMMKSEYSVPISALRQSGADLPDYLPTGD